MSSLQEAIPIAAPPAPAPPLLAPTEVKEEDATPKSDQPVDADIDADANTNTTPAPAAAVQPATTDTPLPSTPSAPTTSTAPVPAAGLTKKDYEVMVKMVKYLTEYKDEDGEEIAGAFQRIVDKRAYPDYWQLISEPIAFSTVRQRITKKQYKGYKDFVRDIARIWHNAQVYNRPSAGVYQVAVTLREAFKAQLQKLVDEKIIPAEDAELPYLGELPELEPSPPPGPDDEEVEEEEDDDDEDEEEEESDDERPKKGRKKGARRSSPAPKRDGKAADDTAKEDPDAQKKRGRPPKVHTPMEARINSLLKGLRKTKNPAGDLKILHFEKMPDKSTMPEYYTEIKTPIAMDIIKRKAKRKKYQSVDQALKDLELMFENAKSYNLEESQVYKDAVDLQKQARALAEQEKKKPDKDFVDEDGRLPLPEILFEGELWKVGDWVHLTNANDVTKPIVAQIYRTWQDQEGQKWINACWYYRPEQTVHRYEKHFFENEVVKTGQYRDHKIEEVVDRCFVMFFTRYHKGRPRGFPADKEVYVCEARYNEEKFKLNKIKTWASCVPDEVREKDYEMDLFDVPRKLKKVPSPIKHLLREDAKEDDALPKPTWGQPNAPPIVGAVHRRPRESNESPPPEPTPSPQPTPEPVRRPIAIDRPRYDSQGDANMTGTNTNASLPSPTPNQATTQSSYGQSFAPVRPSASPAPLMHQTSYGSHTSNHSVAQPSPMYQPQNTYNQYAAAPTPIAQHQPSHNNYQYQTSHSTPRPTAPSTTTHAGHTNAYNPPRTVEVYILPEAANASIPADVRSQFHCDDLGKVLFFTSPPLDANPIPEEVQSLGHSLRYLADKARQKDENEKKRKIQEVEFESAAKDKLKRLKSADENKRNWLVDQQLSHVQKWSEELAKGTDDLYQKMYGDNWQEMRNSDTNKLVLQQADASKYQTDIDNFQKMRKAEAKGVEVSGFRWI